MSTEEPTILVSTTNRLPEHSSPEGFNDAKNLENKHPMTNLLGKSPSKQMAETNVQSRPNPLKVFSSRVSGAFRQQEIESAQNKKETTSSSSSSLMSSNEKTNDTTTEFNTIVPLRPADVSSLAKNTFDYSNGGSKQAKKSQNGGDSISALEGKDFEETQQKSSSSSRVTTITTTKSPQTTVSISSVLSEAKKSSIQTEEEKGWIESFCFPFREISNQNKKNSAAMTVTTQFEAVEINDDIVIGVAGLPPHMADEMQKQDSWILFQEARKSKDKEMNGSSSSIESDVKTKTTTKTAVASKKNSTSKKSSLVTSSSNDILLQPSEAQQQQQSSKKNELKVKLSLKRPATAQSSSDPGGNSKPARGKKKKLKSSETISSSSCQLPNEKASSSSAASASSSLARKRVSKLDAEELDAHLRIVFNSIELIRRVLFPQCLSTAETRPKPSPELAASWWNACSLVLNQRNEPGALAILEEVLVKFQNGVMNHAGLMVTVAGALAGEDRLMLGFDMFLPTGLSMAYILAYIKVLQAALVFLDRSLIHNRMEMIRLIRKGVVELSSALQNPERSTASAVPRVLAHVKSSPVSYEDEVALLGLKGLEPAQALIGWIDLFEKRFGKGSEHENKCEMVLRSLQTLSDNSISLDEMSKLLSKVSSLIPDNAYRLSFQEITQRFLKLEMEENHPPSSSSSAAAVSTTTNLASTIAI